MRIKVVAVLIAIVFVAAACTPEQFQQWWTGRGNAPMQESELSESARGATLFWQEKARRNRFVFEVHPISAGKAAAMAQSTWRPGCPVPLSSLRYLVVSHMDFGGRERVGEIVVNASAVMAVHSAFKAMWDESFPVQQMRPVRIFDGDDARSMAANNTSGFNCRKVAGSNSWSQHSYGTAVDINPAQNPYVRGSTVEPAAGAAFVDRGRLRPGMLHWASAANRAFANSGWGWGGNWRSSKDYQHFSANGG